MDLVIIKNFELLVQIGCHAEERQSAQRILLSCSIACDFSSAIASSQVADTVCYVGVATLARELIEGQPWILLEQAGDAFIHALFEKFPAAQHVQLTLKKFVVPGADWTGVHLERTR